MAANVGQAVAELPILRDFIDFLNAQLGVYLDCLSSFQGNKARVERQVMRVIRPAASTTDPLRPVVSVSYEDPSQPDIILHRITAASDYSADNASEGYNERQIVWALIIFIFTYWDEDVRKRIAHARQVEPSLIAIDVFGDLRLIRNEIVHNGGLLREAAYNRLKILSDLCEPDTTFSLDHDEVQVLFVRLKQAVAGLTLSFVGDAPGRPEPSDIVGLAIGGPAGGPRRDQRYVPRSRSKTLSALHSLRRAIPDSDIVFSVTCGIFNVQLFGTDIVVPRARTSPITRSMLPTVIFPNNIARTVFRATHDGAIICDVPVVVSWETQPPLSMEPWLKIRTPRAKTVVEQLKVYSGRQVELAFCEMPAQERS